MEYADCCPPQCRSWPCPRKAVTESVADADAAAGGVAAVDRAMSLMAVFTPADRTLSLGELAERTRLYKSTVLRPVSIHI